MSLMVGFEMGRSVMRTVKRSRRPSIIDTLRIFCYNK